MDKVIPIDKLAIELIYAQFTGLGVVSDRDKRNCEIAYNILRSHRWIPFDELDQLRTRIKELEAELQATKDLWNVCEKKRAELEAEVDKLETARNHYQALMEEINTERDRYREALEEIDKCINKGYSGVSLAIKHYVKTALEGK